MDPMPDLRTCLIDVLYEIRDSHIPLIIGGGYGIFLKREYVRELGKKTLLREWPEARSTNDIDLFLRPQLLIAPEQLKPLSDSLKQLGYTPIPGAEKYQFARTSSGVSEQGAIKIDFLTGPRAAFANSNARVDDRRVSPRPSIDLHAHHVDEAITLEDDLLELPFAGTTSLAMPFESKVFLPHPLTFVMMKLFAFRDRKNDEDKSYGQYHALDIYSVIGATMEFEWNRAVQLVGERRDQPAIIECRNIVQRDFSTRSSIGIVRLRESPYFRSKFEVDEFIQILEELFRAAGSSEER